VHLLVIAITLLIVFNWLTIRDSSVDVVTRLTAWMIRDSIFCSDKRFFFSFPSADTLSGGPSILLLNGYRDSFARGKAAGREFNHSPSSSVEFKNEWRYTFTPHAFVMWREKTLIFYLIFILFSKWFYKLVSLQHKFIENSTVCTLSTICRLRAAEDIRYLCGIREIDGQLHILTWLSSTGRPLCHIPWRF
jgi:hypothetical protein